MIKPSIYLAGPITGLSYEGALDWREQVKKQLEPEIDCFSPLRAKHYLQGQTSLADQYTEYVLSSQRGIYARDKGDCMRCDLLFVNLLGAQKVSIGTIMEISWGALLNKHIVLIMEKEGNVHEHAMVREACPFRVETLEEGVWLTRSLLLP